MVSGIKGKYMNKRPRKKGHGKKAHGKKGHGKNGHEIGKKGHEIGKIQQLADLSWICKKSRHIDLNCFAS